MILFRFQNIRASCERGLNPSYIPEKSVVVIVVHPISNSFKKLNAVLHPEFFAKSGFVINKEIFCKGNNNTENNINSESRIVFNSQGTKISRLIYTALWLSILVKIDSLPSEESRYPIHFIMA